HKGIEIESVGGQNRFLGISLLDGNLFSVGWRETLWVEWRPFLLEDIPANFPKARFIVRAGHEGQFSEGDLERLPEEITQLARKFADESGVFRCEGYLQIPLQAVGQLLVLISSHVARLHKDEKIHGDIKPENILLTAGGPILVDAFNIS